MKLSLRLRIFLTLVPLFVLTAVLGTAGAVLLYRLGGSIDRILKENYRSVLYMEGLNEALERIDSSFQLALSGQEAKGRQQYESNHWQELQKNLDAENANITLPGEAEMAARLSDLVKRYRRQGDDFYAAEASTRKDRYAGLLESYREIKSVSRQILRLNQENMEQASREARTTAESSRVWFGAGLLAAVVLSGFFAWSTIRTILAPIQAVTQSALAISNGRLDQVVPAVSRDELGQLAAAFNTMARHLREYRQSNSARLLRVQRTSQATIDSFPDPVLVVDSEGFVEMANPAARRLLGVTPTTPDQGGSLPWQPPEALRSPLLQALEAQRNFLPEGFDRAIQLQAGAQERSFLPRILTIGDPYGHTLGAAILLQDVTRFRLLDQFKTDLVATVSHELKTPLTSLRLDLHLLLEEALGPLSPKQTELLLDARDNAERLLAIVNNLLDLAHLEQQGEHLEIRAESAVELLQAAAAATRPRAADKQIELEVETAPNLPLVAVDSVRLRHALDNLLDNALTYTEPGGRVKLSAEMAAEMPDGEAIALSVADTGCGIPPEYLPHVFNRFFRVPGNSRGSGTGLGLAIVREIITAQGGKVTCQSQPGAGTVFRITLPAAKGPADSGIVFGSSNSIASLPP